MNSPDDDRKSVAPLCLNLLVIRSDDMPQAVTFYEAMGLKFTLHSHGTGPEHYSTEANQVVFEIYPASKRYPPTTSTRFGFAVPSVDDTMRSLADRGAEIVSQPKDSEWGRRAVVKDFDGHFIELTQRS